MIDSDMKKITNLLYMLAVLLLASCSDFLDKSPKNTVDPETTVTDDVAIALTNACYSHPSVFQYVQPAYLDTGYCGG